MFANVRILRVLVPPGYDAAENRARRYPVLYLNDGQNLFDATTSVLNPMEWRVDETVHSVVTAGWIRPMIVVGIDNAGRRGRFREYFPYVDEYLRPPEPDPQGKRYPSFLVDEVIPFIEARYRYSTPRRAADWEARQQVRLPPSTRPPCVRARLDGCSSRARRSTWTVRMFCETRSG